MKFKIELPSRPFKAIKLGTKKVEGRVPENDSNKYQKMVQGDEIEITNEDSLEKMTVKIQFINHYSDVKTMLETEGVKNVLSSGGTIEEGIERYNSFAGYKENLPKYGIYAIGVKPIN